ncbi:MAG: sugar phosphate isomerase/epimerase family protein [Ignavibacteria bacterium]
MTNNKTIILLDVNSADAIDLDKLKKLDIGICLDLSNTDLIDSNYENIINEWKNKLTGFNKVLAVHGVAFDLNPGSTDKKVVELTNYRYKQSINAAKSLNADYVIFHSQINPWIRDKKLKEIKAKRQIGFWHELVNLLENSKLKILIENVYESEFEDLQMLVRLINSPKVKICFDIGHMLCSSKQSIGDWIKNLKPFIALVHLHWNDGTNDSHLAPRDNNLKLFDNLVRDYELNIPIELEYPVTDLNKEILRIRKYLN